MTEKITILKGPSKWNEYPAVRVLQHILFVGFSYVILLQLFKIDQQTQLVDHVYTILFLATILPVVYINLKVLLPRAGKSVSWFLYILLLAVTTAVFVWLNIQLFDKWSVLLFKDLFFISYYNWWQLLLFFIVFLIVTSLLKLSKSWFAVQEIEKRILAIEKQKVDMELLALKAQVNPHFFFNTLNSIYSLSLDKDDRLPATVLQLSGIMRYYLYESKDDYVPLEREIQILKDYIELQRIRSTKDLNIEFQADGDFKSKNIPPLLLLTFVENAFKHGAKAVSGAAYIHIKIESDRKQLYFSVQNNRGSIDEIELNGFRGIGLENVRRRLALLYPERHSLTINKKEKSFEIDLRIGY